MAYTMKEFTEADLSKLRGENPVCVLCKGEIAPGQERREYDAGQVHDECHFDALSAVIDRRPIHRLGVTASTFN